MPSKFKIGIIQQNIQSSSFGIKNRVINMNNIEKSINSLMDSCKDLDVIVLSEEFYTGSSYNFTSIPEEFSKNKGILRLREIANKYQCYIIGGLTGWFQSDNKDKRYKNIGFIIGRDGEVIGQQERMHLFEQESEFIMGGNVNQIFDLDTCKVALVSGIDMFDYNIIDKAVSEGAKLIFSPSLIPVLYENKKYKRLLLDKWRSISIAMAMEKNIFIVGVNGIGSASYTDGFFGGRSLVAGPFGVIKEFGESEEFDAFEMDLEDIELAKNYLSNIILNAVN